MAVTVLELSLQKMLKYPNILILIDDLSYCLIYTVKPAHAFTFLKQSPVLRGHLSGA